MDLPPSASLRQRLPRLGPAAVAAQNLLCSGGAVLRRGALHWRFSPARAGLAPAIALRGAQSVLLLSLAQDGLRDSLGEREWWDYAGEALPLAWTLAHGALLEGLAALCGEPLLAMAWHAELPPARLEDLHLNFSAASDGGSAAGTLRLPAELGQRWAGLDGWQPDAGRLARWGELPAHLRIVLRSPPFPLAEIQAAAVGDTLICGRRAQCWSSLRLHGAGAHAWSAAYDGQRLHLTANPSRLETAMSDQAPAAAESPLQNIPVVLDFELGELSLPLAELANLRQGYVFQLPQPLEQARVTIRANGVAIGQGELVAVGEVLGVQLLALDPHGLR